MRNKVLSAVLENIEGNWAKIRIEPNNQIREIDAERLRSNGIYELGQSFEIIVQEVIGSDGRHDVRISFVPTVIPSDYTSVSVLSREIKEKFKL